MQIRTRLTIQFLLLAEAILILAFSAIYYSSATYRRTNFYDRLTDRAWSTAKLLIDTYRDNPEIARRVERTNPAKMENEKIIIINLLNDVIYTTDQKNEIEIKNDVLEHVRQGRRIRERQGDYEVMGVLYTSFNNRFVVLAAATDSEGYAYLNRLRIIMLIVLLISFALFSIAGWLYSGRALKPISDMVKEVDDITITSLNLRVPEGNGTDEIGRLAKTFNRMLERLESSFTMQKSFIANASHELRTPLTAINGQLEVLLMKDRTTDEYKHELTSVMDDIRSLIYLANRLLLIARTSAETPSNSASKLQVDEILWQSRDEMTRFNDKYRINIEVDESMTDSGQMVVKGDEYLLKTALSNIMDNACKYSDDHTVNIRIKPSGRYIGLHFEDKGIGIPEDELKKVFEPFYRASNAIAIRGSGIGLQLVSQIIRNHNGEIEISSAVNKGTTVIIKLPVAG
jgi:signal transduction histidine kinase